MKQFLVCIAFVAVALWDGLRLLREHKVKEAVVFGGLLLIALLVALLQLASVKLPNPVQIIRSATDSIIDLLGLEPFF